MSGLSIRVIDAMVAAGLTPEQMASVMKAVTADAVAKADEQRAKAAAKKRLQRAKRPLMSLDVPGTKGDDAGQMGTNGDIEAPTQSNPSTFLSEERASKEKPPIEGGQKKGSRLPDDWLPKPRHFDKAFQAGWPPAFVENQAEAMREWAIANGNRPVARKADWDKTFDGWLRREMEKGARAPPRQMNGKPSAQEVARRLELELKAREHEQPPPPPDRPLLALVRS